MSVVDSVSVVVSVALSGGTVSDEASEVSVAVVVIVASSVLVLDSVVAVEPCSVASVVSLPGSVDGSPCVVLPDVSPTSEPSVDWLFELHDASNTISSIAVSVTHPQARRIHNEYLAGPMNLGYSTGSVSIEWRIESAKH